MPTDKKTQTVEKMRANKGLEGLIADDSAVSKVDPEKLRLRYRGYDINELCEQTSFMETAYLLLYGKLPNRTELAAFEKTERASRVIPDALYRAFADVPKTAHPMDYVRLGVTFMSLFDTDNALGDIQHESNLRKAIRTFSALPTIIGASHRIVNGKKPVAPDPALGYSENFLSMMLGKRITDKQMVKTFDNSLILYAEHGFNASTFSARVTASTMSDYYSAVSTAIGTLKGPLHGGANEEVMHMLLKIGTPENAEPWLRDKLAKKEKVMGFGHRVYRNGDSRVPLMKNDGLKLAKALGNTRWHDISEILETIMIKEKNIHPNLDFPTATAYYLMGIPIDLYTPIFVASRVTGWSAHILEQHDDNRLIRPGCAYTGPDYRPIPPIDQR